MSIDSSEPHASSQCYRGFSSPRAAPPRRRLDRTRLRRIAAGGAIAAVTLGVAVGLWAKPLYRAGADQPLAVSTQAPVGLADGRVQIVMDEPRTPPPGGRMEVLPKDLAAQAPPPLRLTSAPNSPAELEAAPEARLGPVDPEPPLDHDHDAYPSRGLQPPDFDEPAYAPEDWGR